MSYPFVEMMTWQGLGDLINRFRAKTLHLDEVSTLWAPGQLFRLKVPYTYMWSPGLVPKPKDWGPEIDIAGFVFLDLASSFKPPDDLAKFLDAGKPPVYIGFGSIVVDDPDAFTKLIFKAVELAGVRALVSKGWGGFGSNATAPDNIFMLENTPHDWLFPRVSAVVHHGGAGTTAIGLKCGKPTMIVPFFGDQSWWAAMVTKAKAGAHESIPYKQLTAEKLAEGIKQCLTPEARENAQKIADSIAAEGDGALNAVRSFHRSLPIKEGGTMRCSLLPNQAAAWRLKDTSIRLSPLAAELLVEWKKVKWNELRLLRQYEWNDFGGPGEPLTGIWGALVDTFADMASGVGHMPVNMARSVKRREKYYEKKYRIKKREREKQQKKGDATKSLPRKASGSSTDNSKASNPQELARKDTTLSALSEPDDLLAAEFAKEAKLGLRKTTGALIRMPMRLHLAVTQGFHNAPRLYGDETVRRPQRVTGFHSGVRAGRDEFVYGIRDGVSGLWMQPFRGVQQSGVLGFVRGIGFGIGGFVLKDIAAIVGPGAYIMKGLDEEYMKKYQPTHFIRRARIMQGRKEVAELESRIPPPPSSSSSHRLKSRGSVDERKSLEAKKWAVEKEVSRKWGSLQPSIKAEKRLNRSGLKAALLGQNKYKQGLPVPLKVRPVTPSGGGAAEAQKNRMKKVASAPAGPEGGADGVPSVDGGAAVPRSETGPAVVENGVRGKKKRGRLSFEPPVEVDKKEIREGAVASGGVGSA